MKDRERLTPPAEFEAILARLVLQLELGVAVVTVIVSAVIFGVLAIGHIAGARVGTAVTLLSLAFCAFYLGEIVLLRLKLYRRSMRYVAAVVDTTLATAIIWLGVQERGVVFALTGGGPMLYLLAVAVSTLRLAPRLCLMAGIVGTLQFILVSIFVVNPAMTAVERELMGTPAFVIAGKSLLILAGGVFGALATRSMRRLLRRITWNAVERDRARGLFGQSASEALVGQLLENGEVTKRRAVTIVSVDVRGFSQLAETRPPDEVTRMLNEYLERIHVVVAAHGGLVNKVFGSSMLCAFLPADGDQDEDAGDAARALAAATEMQRAVTALKLGVGVHRGEALVGSIGGAQRQELSFVGETVNVAIGLQELTRRLGPSVLFTRTVHERAALGVNAGWFEVRGSESLVEVFVLDGEAEVR